MISDFRITLCANTYMLTTLSAYNVFQLFIHIVQIFTPVQNNLFN